MIVNFAASIASSPSTINVNNLSVTIWYQLTGTANYINATTFGFSIPPTTSITGVLLTLVGFASAPCDLSAQLLVNGLPVGNVKTIALPTSAQTFTIGSLSDLWGNFLTPDNANSLDFGVQLVALPTSFPLATVSLDSETLTLGLNTGTDNFQFITTFTAQNGDVKNIALDANGNLYVEDVTNNPGELTLALEGITPNSYAVGVNGPDVEYLAFSDGITGSDIPRQYTPNWIDRITQVGPGASPVFSPQQSSNDSYDISTITQPAQQVWSAAHNSQQPYYLQSQGPGLTTPGLVGTVYYADSTTISGPDADLVTAFNSGNPVYVYMSFYWPDGPTTIGPYTVQVTSVGKASPPSQPREFYYYTYAIPSGPPAYIYYQGDFTPGNVANYQRTLATMTMAEPVPGLIVGDVVTITGTTESGYNNVWPISQTINSATMAITETGIVSGVATFTYALTGGSTSAPTAGQLVTITGTTNANGALNLTNATIATATGGNSGSFTVAVSLPNASTVAEDGLATTAGTIFAFDPGLPVLGTSTSPIYGYATGGSLTFEGSGQFIGPGTRQGVVFFITRNGYYTAPSPPVTFTCPENTTNIVATNIPIGPPNVVARGIAFTEAGQNGTPGANFFTIPIPVTYIVNNVSYTATALIINDNTTTSASFFFTDSVLLTSEAIDVYGYNLFNQIEIGNPGWIVNYAGRNFYGLCQNKIQNFLNLSFDGGYLSGQSSPLGWTTTDAYGGLQSSPIFGNAYYIKNTTGGTLAVAGLITQTAYQDSFQQPIIDANTEYSVRVTARCPSGNTTGNLVVSLVANNTTFGAFTIPFASLSTTMKIYTGTLLTTEFTTVLPALTIQIAATEIGAGADVEIDRIEPFPTAIPVLYTTVYGSYAGLPEQVDSITGMVVFSSENQQPVNGAMVMYDTLYGLKAWSGKSSGSSLYSLQSSANLEPAQWQEPEVAQRSGGAAGMMAYDLGEQWFLGASRPGLYLFEGGQPGKIMQEIYQVWDSINWNYGYTIWVKVDITNRKIYVGVPMATPNFWLPNAPLNANPTSPNLILMCNYQGLDSGQELKSMPQMHTTMFGTLNAIDMRRKWSIWEIPSPYANFVQTATDQEFYICNGIENFKIYKLDENAETDDGTYIDSLYTTAGLVELSKRQQTQGVGNYRIRWDYLVAALQSQGNIGVTLYPNRLLGPGNAPDGYNSWALPGGFSPGDPALNDSEASLNFAATLTFIEFRENDGHAMSLSNLVLHAKADVWNALRGAK